MWVVPLSVFWPNDNQNIVKMLPLEFDFGGPFINNWKFNGGGYEVRL